ncbi:MAG: flagellar motor stator protein MotA, partial [Pseudomonadales bacterium]
MKFFIGLFGVIGSVLGGYVLSGGFLIQLYHPPELMIIAGGALFALVIGSSVDTVKGIGRDLKYVVKGVKYKTENYLELFSFLFLLFDKGRRSGMLALEDDVDRPEESEIWQQFPTILHNHHVKDFVCDIVRIKILGNLNVHEIEALMDIELDTHHHEAMLPSGAMQTMADGLPAFGIVAAVMGVVITMGYISEPPEVLGMKVGAALVGTFVGVLLAYGFAGPIASALKSVAEEDGAYIICIKTCLIADIQGYQPNMAL